MKTLGLNKTDKASQLNRSRSLILNSASLSREKDVKNKMSTPSNSKEKNILFKKSKYAYNSRKRIFGISYYLKKKHERLSRKKTHKKISASNLYLKNTFQDIYSKKQRFASRMYTKSRARRLFRRSFFSSVRFIKLFFDATNPINDSSNFVIKKAKVNSEQGLRNELQTSVFNRTDASRPPLQQRYLQFLKEVPRIHTRQLLSAHFQHFIKLRGTEDCEREAAFLKRKKSGFDFSKESTTLFHRKRSKLASYFFSRKLRKKVFPFFSELRKNSFVANATKMESNSTFTNNNLYSNKSKISLTHGYHKRNQKRRKSVLPLPIYQRSIFSAPRLRKSIFLKLLKLKKRKNFLTQQKIKSNYKNNGKAIGLNKIQGFFKKKKKIKNAYALNGYRKKGVINFRENKKAKSSSPFNKNNNKNNPRIEVKFARNKYRKYGKLRYKQKRIRFFRRKLKRFFRRRRYRIRRRRAFPRLKSVHIYFPTYVQNDFRTLRSIKISHPKTKEIFTGFRLSPAKMFSFYKTRGYLFSVLMFII
jgi:hypothetical protein